MEVTNEFGMKLLIASCPNCESNELYCGKIPTMMVDFRNKEVLFCKQCKFVIPVRDFKKMLFTV